MPRKRRNSSNLDRFGLAFLLILVIGYFAYQDGYLSFGYQLCPTCTTTTTMSLSTTTLTSTSTDPPTLPNIVPRTNYPCQGACYAVQVNPSISGSDLSIPIEFLAGVQDRTIPQIYLLSDGNNCNTGGTDECWLSYIQQNYAGIKPSLVSQTSILQHYVSLVHSYIEYSSSSQLQFVMAQAIGDADNAVPIGSNALSILTNLAPQLTSDINVGNQPCLSNSDPWLACSEWLWNNYGPETGKTSVNIFGTLCGAQAPDYYAYTRAFVFVLNSNCAASMTTSDLNWLTTSVLPFYGSQSSSFQMHSVNLGYLVMGPEVSSVSLMSQWQIFYIAATNDFNLGWMSGLPELTNLNQNVQQLTYNPNETYLTFSYTQGNGVMWYQYRYLGIINGSSTTVDWEINGLMAALAPPILKYWYSQNNQYYITSNSGSASYVHPQMLANENYWGSISHAYACNAGQSVSFGIFDGASNLQQTYQNYENAVGAQNVAIWAPETHGQGNQFIALNNNVQVASPAWGMNTGADGSDNYAEYNDTGASALANLIKTSSSHFIYIDFFSGAAPSESWIQKIMSDLGAGYQNVNFAQYFNLYDQSKNLSPPVSQC